MPHYIENSVVRLAARDPRHATFSSWPFANDTSRICEPKSVDTVKNEPIFPTQIVKLSLMQSLPVSLYLKNRKCLIVGFHPRAAELAHELARLQAKVVIISEQCVPVQADALVLHRHFTDTDLDDCWLVVAASQSGHENNAIKKLCDTRQLFCHVIADDSSDTEEHVFEQEDHKERQARADSESRLENLGSWQPIPGTSPAVTTASLSDSTSRIDAQLPDHQSALVSAKANTGLVSLVGAGPGDPELLTLRALSRIKNADAVVYDRLVSKPILNLCNADAEFVYAGKARANHTLPQNSINTLLVELAGKYERVVRLKGGDPFIFGRGGEEIETLADQQVAFEVVPGITAASGCAAFSGIPLTHRDHAQSCIFVTGHLRNGTINLNWQELTDPQQTIVVYMGLTGVDAICRALVDHGRSAQTPAALIEQGTKPQQRVLASTLRDLPELVARSDVSAPTLLIIGGVVSLRDKLKWFES